MSVDPSPTPKTATELRAERLREIVWLVSPLFGGGFAKPAPESDIAMVEAGKNYAAYLAFRDGFANVLDTRFYSIEWLDQQVLIGAVKVFAAGDAAVAFDVRPYPTGALELHFLAGTGNLETLTGKLREAVENWARGIGCIVVTVSGRSGWVRALKPHGYEMYQSVIRKEL